MIIANCCTLSTSQKHLSLLSAQKLCRSSISFHIGCELVLMISSILSSSSLALTLPPVWEPASQVAWI